MHTQTALASVAIVAVAVIAGVLAMKSRSPVAAVTNSTPFIDGTSLGEVGSSPRVHERERMTRLPAEEPHVLSREENPRSGAQGNLSMQESLAGLRRRVEEPLFGTNLEAAVLEKYRGLEAVDLLQIYPFLSDAQSREMTATLREAIDTGNFVSEVAPSGQPVDYDKYKQAGETFLTVASRSEPLGNGLVEHKIVAIDRAGFPEMYARTFEEIWVHERIDEAGICTICTRPPPGNVQVTVTENRR